MRYIKKFESSDYGSEKIKEIADFIGNIFDILLPYSDDGYRYVMDLQVNGRNNDKTKTFDNIHFEPEDIYEDIQLYIEEYLERVSIYDKIGYSLKINLFNFNYDLLDVIIKRIKSEYSPDGGNFQKYVIDEDNRIYVMETRPNPFHQVRRANQILIYDPIFWKEFIK